MPQPPLRNLGDRTFRFACDVVTYCRELSKEPGVVAKAAYSRREFAAKNSGVLKELRGLTYGSGSF
jgi:hypothetical protein